MASPAVAQACTRSADMPSARAPSAMCFARGPTVTSTSIGSRATTSPTRKCASSVSEPSSAMSPRTAMRRSADVHLGECDDSRLHRDGVGVVRVVDDRDAVAETNICMRIADSSRRAERRRRPCRAAPRDTDRRPPPQARCRRCGGRERSSDTRTAALLGDELERRPGSRASTSIPSARTVHCSDSP